MIDSKQFTLSTHAKHRDAPAPNHDYYARSSVNAKVVSHFLVHGLQKMLLVTRILKEKKINRMNKIQTCYFCYYFHYCCLSYTQFIAITHCDFFGNSFFILSEYASISNSLDLFSSLMPKYCFLDLSSILILKEHKKAFYWQIICHGLRNRVF